MSNTYYRLYVESVLRMAKTLVIKSELSAKAINDGLKELLLYVNENDPKTWKYYLNLNGQYHYSDKEMVVKSLDTLEDIVFNKENLEIHSSTKRQYSFGTRFYNDLVSRFPDQENLILGILNPIDIEVAINSPNGKILYIDNSLIESNEENFIEELQKRIDSYFVRWSLDPYSYTDDLFAAAQLAILYMNIPKFILNIRLENCRTNYVHSFHIRQYLASKGRLDSFIDNLTKKQMLFLYRNINYIHRNAGKNDTFKWLIQNIFTDRGIPLSEYEMRHNLTQMPEYLKPTIDFNKNNLNDIYVNDSSRNISVREMLEKQIPIARDNINVIKEEEVLTNVKMKNSILSKVKTKVLESSMIDMSESDPNPFTETLFNYWLYLSCNNKYNAVIFIDNPKTGEQMQLSSKDAFILFLYSLNKVYGIELPNVPTIWANKIQKNTLPSLSDIKSLIDKDHYNENLVKNVYNTITSIVPVISVDAFYNQCVVAHKAIQQNRLLYTTIENYKHRGSAEILVKHFYKTVECNLANEMSYSQWFNEKNIDVDDLTLTEFQILSFNLFQNSTGLANNKSITLKEIQGSMIRLMTQLSSYSVHFLQDINTGPLTVIDWSAIRLGDVKANIKDSRSVDILNFRLLKNNAKVKAAYKHNLLLNAIEWNKKAKQRHIVKLETNVNWNIHSNIRTHSRGNSLMIDLKQPNCDEINT